MLSLLEFIAGVLEFIVGLGELLEWWRFFVCLFLAIALVVLIFWLIPNRTACFALSFPTVAIGVVTGVLWELRHK